MVLKVKISNKINPYFFPEKAMLNNKSIIYTDINSKGIQGLIQYDLSKKKSRVIFKGKNIFQRIELCENHSYIFLGLFPLNRAELNSSIYKFKKNKQTYKKSFELIYNSKTNDIGGMIVTSKKKPHFIKNVIKKDKNSLFEIAKLNIKSKKVKIITDLKNATNIISIDKKLLTLKDGEYYL